MRKHTLARACLLGLILVPMSSVTTSFVTSVFTSVVAAQEPIPPPAPEQEPRRGERLRKLGGRLLESLSTIPEEAQGLLDTDRLNDALAEILEPLLAGEPAVDYLRVGFDPEETDFAHDTVKAFASAGLNRTAWSPDPSQLDLTLSARLDRPADAPPAAGLTAELLFETDVLSLANYAIPRLVRRLEARSGDTANPWEAELRSRVAAKLAQTPPLETLDDVADLILYLSGLRLSSVNDHIEQLKGDLAAATEDAEIAEIEDELVQVRRERDQLFLLRPAIERDPNGGAVAVVVTINRIELRPGTFGRGELLIAPDRISFGATAEVNQGLEAYLLFKPVVTTLLARIQARRDGELPIAEGAIGAAWEDARGWLFGEP